MRSNFIYVMIILFFFIFTGCTKRNTVPAIWGGQFHNVKIDNQNYQCFWQVHGCSIPPKLIFKTTISNDDWDWDWSTAVVLIAYGDSPEPYLFSFNNMTFDSTKFTIEDKECTFPDNAQKIIFYTDEQCNVRKLIVGENLSCFNFLIQNRTPKTTPEDVIKFWNELQNFNSESTVFWHIDAK